MLSTLPLLFLSVVYTESQIHSCNSGYAVLVPCCTTANHLTDDITNVYCPSGCMSKSLSIWGTDIYTENSPICMAAIHAGVGSNGGGYVTVVKMPGQANYISSIKNGIGSLSYQTSARSFMLFTNLTASTVSSSTIAAVPSTSPPTSSTAPGFTSADNVSPSSSTALPASSSSSTALPASSSSSTALPASSSSSTALPASSSSSTALPASSTASAFSTAFPSTLPSSTTLPATSNAIVTTGVSDTTTALPSSTDLPPTSDAIITNGVADTTTTPPSSTDFPATSDATITTGYSDSTTTAPVKADALVDNIASMSDILQSDSSSLAADTILAANALSTDAPITSATPIHTEPKPTDLTTTTLVDIVQGTCATTASGLSGSITMVQCPSDCLVTGQDIWGTYIYTDDSSICKAAIHAGILENNGGLVTVKKMPGQSSYSGSSRNGITSYSYGYFSGSFIF